MEYPKKEIAWSALSNRKPVKVLPLSVQEWSKTHIYPIWRIWLPSRHPSINRPSFLRDTALITIKWISEIKMNKLNRIAQGSNLSSEDQIKYRL